MKKNATLLLLIVLGLTWSAYAHTLVTTFSGQHPVWTKMPIPYWINQSGLPHFANGSEFSAIHAAFRSWQEVPTAVISFQYMGTTPIRTVGQDGYNVITFADETAPVGSDVAASVFIYYDPNSGGTLIREVDIALNPKVDWSTSGEPGKWDVQGILTHSIGHLLGMDHSAMLSSVMTPYSGPERLDQRVLTYDDMAGVTGLYPNQPAVAGLGSISGTVYSGSTPVFGAHVVAMDFVGTPLVSTLTWPDGTYRLNYLPAGPYWVYAEPLDRPIVEQNIEDGHSAFFQKLNTDFSTTYYGDLPVSDRAPQVQISAGQKAVGMDIRVLPASALNLTDPAGFAPRIQLENWFPWTLGGNSLTSGLALSASTPGILLEKPVFGGSLTSAVPTSVSVEVTITPSTALGPKNLSVSRDGRSSVLSGAIVIVNAWPAGIQANPSAGTSAGGTVTVISGSNFREGAQVYFGGLPGLNVRYINSNSLQVTTPPNVAGGASVLVVNTDGTWGRTERAFTYSSGPTPKVMELSPSSGPPMTRVAILGSDLDEQIKNLDVRFNGISAKVVSASRERLEALVPYGASTGSVTVAVLGQIAAGPLFTVTAAPASSNLASSDRPFLDATTGTQIALSNTDDATSLVELPFAFSLFSDTYPAGTPVAVCTNGWLSLDAVTTPEYQNGSLPGSEVQRPDGSKGSIPPSLIAPFFSDLFVRAGLISSPQRGISTRTFGSAPNRQFVIEWSNMGIMTEHGTDSGGYLTFEVILYEGSNDIQFIYQTLSGKLSDGSSATIGIQDSTRTLAMLSGYNQAILSTGYSICYHFDNGTYTRTTSTSSRPYSVVELGGVSVSTVGGAGGSVITGYATVRPDSNNTSPAGLAIVSSRLNGVVVSETSVEASLPLSTGRVYAELSEKVGTGVALVNTSQQVATVSFYFTDRKDLSFGHGSFEIQAHCQFVGFLDQPPFYGLNNFQGTWTFSSDVPLSAAAFRGLINERGEFLTTALPIVDISNVIDDSAEDDRSIILPQFADGGGWSTHVLLVNPNESTVTGTIEFVDAVGKVLAMTANGQTLSSFSYSISGRSSYELLTSGGGQSMKSGWIRIVPASGSMTVSPTALLSFKSNGKTGTEYVASPIWGTSFRSYVEWAGVPGAVGSIQSGLIIVNPSPDEAELFFELFGLDGSYLGLSNTMTMAGGAQMVLPLSEIFASQAMPQSGQGVLRMTTSGSGHAIAGYRSRTNERGELLMIAMQPMNDSGTALAADRYIPYFSFGGGYSTQFVLFSGTSGQEVTGTLRFLNPSGGLLPMPLP